jgi:hypothetical protein
LPSSSRFFVVFIFLFCLLFLDGFLSFFCIKKRTDQIVLLKISIHYGILFCLEVEETYIYMQ